MFTMPFGLIIILGVLTYLLNGANLGVLYNPHSFILVTVGTLGILFFSSHGRAVSSLVRSLAELIRPHEPLQNIQTTLLELSRHKTASTLSRHRLLQYAQNLWAQGIDAETIMNLLKQKVSELNRETELAVSTLRNISKYPPALGMLGTVFGLVTLFSNLTVENRAKIGPNLSMAMTATLYGLILANMLLLPLADRLSILHQDRARENRMIFRIIILIHEGQPESIVRDELYGSAA